MQNSDRVSIVILNWNGWRDTLECLESLFKIDYPDYRVIVVDNGSSDDSVKRIREALGNKIDLLELKENLGFARGNNVGIRYALEHFEPAYLLILNNDTTVEPDFLTQLVAALQKNNRAGMAGPKVIDYYSGIFWQKPLPNKLNLLSYLLYATQLYRLTSGSIRLDPVNPSRIYVLPGCCLLLRREAFSQIGFFDENTFLGWEEYIVAERLLKAGYESYFVPASRIRHKVGKDTDKIPAVEKIRIFLGSERYFQKSVMGYGFPVRFTVRMARFIIYSAMLISEKRAKEIFKVLRNMEI